MRVAVLILGAGLAVYIAAGISAGLLESAELIAHAVRGAGW